MLLISHHVKGSDINEALKSIDKLKTDLTDRCNYVTRLEFQLQKFITFKVSL